MDGICRDAYRHKATLPAQVWAMTPGQVFALFFRTPKPEPDAVAELASVNRDRAGRGEQPSVPFWFNAEMRRGK